MFEIKRKTSTFKTKIEALGFIKKLSFNDIIYNRITMRKIGKLWVISYDLR